MKKIVIVLGLISGLFVSAWMICSIALCYSISNFEGSMSMVLGYASMLLAFALIFVGVKNYRDKHNNGNVSFGKGFQIGLYISLIASTIYVIAWLIDYYLFVPDFMDRFTASSISKIQSSGKSASEIASGIDSINSTKEIYKSPVLIILFTYMEILPVGILVSLITALILKRKANKEQIAAG